MPYNTSESFYDRDTRGTWREGVGRFGEGSDAGVITVLSLVAGAFFIASIAALPAGGPAMVAIAVLSGGMLAGIGAYALRNPFSRAYNGIRGWFGRRNQEPASQDDLGNPEQALAVQNSRMENTSNATQAANEREQAQEARPQTRTSNTNAQFSESPRVSHHPATMHGVVTRRPIPVVEPGRQSALRLGRGDASAT